MELLAKLKTCLSYKTRSTLRDTTVGAPKLAA
jgi:hypothetical protein